MLKSKTESREPESREVKERLGCTKHNAISTKQNEMELSLRMYSITGPPVFKELVVSVWQSISNFLQVFNQFFKTRRGETDFHSWRKTHFATTIPNLRVCCSDEGRVSEKFEHQKTVRDQLFTVWQPGCERTLAWISLLLNPWQNSFFCWKKKAKLSLQALRLCYYLWSLHTWGIGSMDSLFSADQLLASPISC